MTLGHWKVIGENQGLALYFLRSQGVGVRDKWGPVSMTLHFPRLESLRGLNDYYVERGHWGPVRSSAWGTVMQHWSVCPVFW